MRAVPFAHTHLWNELPEAERQRLHPYMVESHVLHLEQTRDEIIRGYQRTLAAIDAQIDSLKSELPR